jgi:hypothetical protein
MLSIDRHALQYSFFVVSCTTNSFLITLHILHCELLFSGNGCHLVRLFIGAIHRLFTCVVIFRLSVRSISLCVDSRKCGLLVMVFDHSANSARLVVTSLTAGLIMINQSERRVDQHLYSVCATLILFFGTS